MLPIVSPAGQHQGAFAAFLRDDDALFQTPGPEPDPLLQHQSRGGAEGPRALLSPVTRLTGLAMHPALTRPGDPVVRRDRLLDFEARRRFEARAFHTFSQGDLDRPRPTCHPCWSRPERLQSNASKSVCATPIRCVEASMRPLDRDVNAASNGPWPGPLPTPHSGPLGGPVGGPSFHGFRARSRPVRHFVSRAAREDPDSSRAGEGGSDPPGERPRPLVPAVVRHPPGVAPSLALSAWWPARFRAAALSISLSIDLSVRHHIADAVRLLLHLERDRGRSLVNEAVRVRRYDREHDSSLTKTRYQRAGSTSAAA